MNKRFGALVILISAFLGAAYGQQTRQHILGTNGLNAGIRPGPGFTYNSQATFLDLNSFIHTTQYILLGCTYGVIYTDISPGQTFDFERGVGRSRNVLRGTSFPLGAPGCGRWQTSAGERSIPDAVGTDTMNQNLALPPDLKEPPSPSEESMSCPASK